VFNFKCEARFENEDVIFATETLRHKVSQIFRDLIKSVL